MKAKWGDSTKPAPSRNQPTLYKYKNLRQAENLGEEEATRIQQQCKIQKNTKELMHCHYGTNNRAPRWTFTVTDWP